MVKLFAYPIFQAKKGLFYYVCLFPFFQSVYILQHIKTEQPSICSLKVNFIWTCLKELVLIQNSPTNLQNIQIGRKNIYFYFKRCSTVEESKPNCHTRAVQKSYTSKNILKGTFRGQLMQKRQFSLYAVLIPQCLGMILIAESCMSHVYLGSSLMLSKSGFQKSCRGN